MLDLEDDVDEQARKSAASHGKEGAAPSRRQSEPGRNSGRRGSGSSGVSNSFASRRKLMMQGSGRNLHGVQEVEGEGEEEEEEEEEAQGGEARKGGSLGSASGEGSGSARSEEDMFGSRGSAGGGADEGMDDLRGGRGAPRISMMGAMMQVWLHDSVCACLHG